jgi:hypothetical protein
MNERIIAQTTLTLGIFLGQDVTFKRLLTLNLSATGQLETLLSAGFGF